MAAARRRSCPHAATRLLRRREAKQQIAESLDAPLSVEETAWAETAERRAEELRSGSVKGVPADEVFAQSP